MPKFPTTSGNPSNIFGGFRGTEAYRSELAAMRSGGASAASNATIDFPNLTLPWSTIAPPRSLSPASGGPIWRNTMNMIPRDGLMRRRPGIQTSALNGPMPALTAFTNNELPVWIYNYVSPLDEVFVASAAGSCGYGTVTQPSALTIMVTNRQAYIYSTAGTPGWKNVTPTYTTGTVTVTAGSAIVTGAGTDWINAGITGFNHILIAGVWYQLCAANTATSISLRQNYAGSSGSGMAYVIRRTWDTPDDTGLNRTPINNLIYCCLFNQTLYIAGNYVGGSAVGIKEPAIIKVANIFAASPTSSYILGRAQVNPGQDTLPTLSEITGIQALQDGRIVISGCTDTSEGVLFYSSPLADNVWSATPGGQVVVVERPGPIYALGKLGQNLTLHYRDGIVFGIPTGLADPPLAFQATPATVGCYMPRTLKNVGGMEVFMSYDANVFTFDGTRTTPIGDEIRTQFGPAISAIYLRDSLHAAVNHKWGEYTIYAPIFTSQGGNSFNTLAYTFRVNDGSWWLLNYPAPIGAVDDASPTTPDYAVIGVYSNNPGSVINMLWTLSSNVVSDVLTFNQATVPVYTLETDDLDFGQSLNYKTADSAVIFLRGFPNAVTATAQMAVSRDGGTTWITSAAKTIAIPNTGEVPLQFSFRDAIGAGLILRYRLILGTGGALNFCPTRLIVGADVGADCGVVQL